MKTWLPQVEFFIASLGYQSLPPTGLGRVDEDMASQVGFFIASLGYQSLPPTGLGRVDEDMASQVGFFIASLGYQSLPPTDLGRVDEDMASPNRVENETKPPPKTRPWERSHVLRRPCS
ncbi:hypothetical protein TNCV_2103381 [Trichonephila clavipes]|nr:hypothetical protein TNCV_2103381 [Trichonephila clavipes]